MDSAGIGMLLGRYKTVQALGGQIIIYDMSESVRRLLEMSGLDRMAIMSDTLQHGINEMKKRRGVQV